MMKFSSDLIVFDLEASCKTFGKNEIEESSIIEIGAVKLDRKSLRIKGEFSELVKPRDFEIVPEISEITGITPELVKDASYFDEVAERFISWYGKKKKCIFAGWGLYYDLPLLRKELRVFGIDYGEHFVGGGFDIRGLAYYWLAKKHLSTSGLSVAKALEALEVKTEFQLHRAVDDARATAMILTEIAKSDC
jgi:DNA polymerase III epsilon subunit-like protein